MKGSYVLVSLGLEVADLDLQPAIRKQEDIHPHNGQTLPSPSLSQANRVRLLEVHVRVDDVIQLVIARLVPVPSPHTQGIDDEPRSNKKLALLASDARYTWTCITCMF